VRLILYSDGNHNVLRLPTAPSARSATKTLRAIRN